MRTPILTSLVAAVLLGTGAAAAHAQNTTVDSRWIAYIGCWESMGTPQSAICLVPAADTSAIDLVTIHNGEVVTAERILANGARIETNHGECRGWQRADWSTVSDRLYLHSQETCPNWGTRTGTGVIAQTRIGQLLYIQGSTVGAKTGVRVQRYRHAATDLVLPSEVADALTALHLDLMALSQAHAAATAPLAVEDISEAARQVDPAVEEAWLVERGGSFILDAKRLLALADAGVPSRITDLLIALSYPGVFAINTSSHQGQRRADTLETYFGGPISPGTLAYGDCMMDYTPFSYGSAYCDGFGAIAPYGYDPYPREYPVIIIYNGSGDGGGDAGGGSSFRSHGRVVNGRGYEEGASGNAEVSGGQPRSSSAGSSGTATSRSAGSASSPSSGEQRTAKPRP